MECNKYLEEFKIDLVKQYLNGRMKKEICEEYVDITDPLKKEYKERSIIKTSNESVRVFKNGYSIICHISKLSKAMRIINND